MTGRAASPHPARAVSLDVAPMRGAMTGQAAGPLSCWAMIGR